MTHFPSIEKQSFKSSALTFIRKYKHALLLLYMLIYFPWFHFLEQNITSHFHVIHMAVDDKIPFIEYFIVPYFLWFAYVAVAVLYFLYKDKNDYYRLCVFLFTGMTVFLLISTVYPNGHYLRPMSFTHDNIFVHMVQLLYASDTATNLFPSIHVYNSIGVHMALTHSKHMQNHKGIQIASFILMVSIILSTMFLKQHSVFDVITGIAFASFMYTLIYGKNAITIHSGSLAEQVRHV